MKKDLKKNEIEKIPVLKIEEDDFTVQKLRELIGNKEMSDEEARETIFAINTLVDIIIDYQYEQELKQNNSDSNLKQAA